MSYLCPPRIHFLGNMTANTPTANNNNYDLVLDPDAVDIFEPYKSMSDEEFRTTMRSLVTKYLPFDLGIMEVLNANWDYDGDNSFFLTNTSVRTADTPDGKRVSSVNDDKIVGLSLTTEGDRSGDTPTHPLIVDNDPTCDLTSQLFTARVALGDENLGFVAQSNASGPLPRCYSRWIDLQRNLVSKPDTCFSAVWQQALPNENLTFFGRDQSPVLNSLAERAAGGRGLVMRFCTYYFDRKYTDQEMADFFKHGKFVQNLSTGFGLGTIGVWGNDEFGSVPWGRQLHPNRKQLEFRVPGAPKGAEPLKYVLGPAAFIVDAEREVVSLDLTTTFPEVNALPKDDLDPRLLEKVNLGSASLQVKAADGQVTDIGALNYSNEAYLSGAGVVEVPFQPSQLELLKNGALQVSCSAADVNPVLEEQVLVAESDDRATYISEGRSTTIEVRVFERGTTLTERVPVGVEQYRIKQTMQEPKGGLPGVPLKHHLLAPNQIEPFLKIEPEGVTVDTDGVLRLKLTGLQPGVGKLRFVPGTNNPPDPDPLNLAAWLQLFFVNVRVLPSDAELDQLSDHEITWELVYDKVLRYYYRLYPVMDQYMRLNDKAAISQRVMALKLLTNEESWHSTLYMPITRELSDGKRRLLHRWCNRVLRGEQT